MAERLHGLLDGKLALLAILPDRLVDASIGTTTDETNDMISLSDMDFTCVSTAGSAGICRMESQQIVGDSNAQSLGQNCRRGGEKNSVMIVKRPCSLPTAPVTSVGTKADTMQQPEREITTNI